jgi:hypothetical protein
VTGAFIWLIWMGGAGYFQDAGRGFFRSVFWPFFLGRAVAKWANERGRK